MDASLKAWLWVIGIVLFLLFILGSSSDSKESRVVNIDCNQPQWANSQYCDGSFENSMKEQDANENTFYQNTVR